MLRLSNAQIRSRTPHSHDWTTYMQQHRTHAAPPPPVGARATHAAVLPCSSLPRRRAAYAAVFPVSPHPPAACPRLCRTGRAVGKITAARSSSRARSTRSSRTPSTGAWTRWICGTATRSCARLVDARRAARHAHVRVARMVRRARARPPLCVARALTLCRHDARRCNMELRVTSIMTPTFKVHFSVESDRVLIKGLFGTTHANVIGRAGATTRCRARTATARCRTRTGECFSLASDNGSGGTRR